MSEYKIKGAGKMVVEPKILAKIGGVACDGEGSHPGGVAILPNDSCYRISFGKS